MTAQFQQADSSGGNDNCITPLYIIKALGGHESFDLDPCYGKPRPWPTARRMLCLEDGQDGLVKKWKGRVWLNQPYSEASLWSERMAKHSNGIMLVFARTETKWFQKYVFRCASGILFIGKRLKFHQPNGDFIRSKKGKVCTAGAPSVLVSYDPPGKSQLNHMKLAQAIHNDLLSGYLPTWIRNNSP